SMFDPRLSRPRSSPMSRVLTLVATAAAGLASLAGPTAACSLAVAPSALMVATLQAPDIRFAIERNAEIAASIAVTERARAVRFTAERNAEIAASIAAVE